MRMYVNVIFIFVRTKEMFWSEDKLSFTLDNFAALFNCTPVDRASDSMMALF